MKFKVGEIVISPDGLAEVLSCQEDIEFVRKRDGAKVKFNQYCLNLIPTARGYTPSFLEHQLRTATDANDILKENL